MPFVCSKNFQRLHYWNKNYLLFIIIYYLLFNLEFNLLFIEPN